MQMFEIRVTLRVSKKERIYVYGVDFDNMTCLFSVNDQPSILHPISKRRHSGWVVEYNGKTYLDNVFLDDTQALANAQCSYLSVNEARFYANKLPIYISPTEILWVYGVQPESSHVVVGSNSAVPVVVEKTGRRSIIKIPYKGMVYTGYNIGKTEELFKIWSTLYNDTNYDPYYLQVYQDNSKDLKITITATKVSDTSPEITFGKYRFKFNYKTMGMPQPPSFYLPSDTDLLGFLYKFGTVMESLRVPLNACSILLFDSTRRRI
jgi:hypothetical protein